ncbi:acyltransferase family protein [Sphingomonas fuzhouensis]|uniref:acyltransferase family protein n=1 Tax=Sphingomonas fuzhouensis TaxID=3106033 RepID=UPI002AFEA545|nr:acyltransferase [Sphingomonas sp. SGZ-02]
MALSHDIRDSGDVSSGRHLGRLDGCRGIAILAVMTGHMLPFGRAAWGGNVAIAAAGMAIFFALSGFLIVSLLLRDDAVIPFIIKRLFRIVPLAWLYILVVIAGQGASWDVVGANLFFFANVSKFWLSYAPHFWSLSVEVQFYAFVAVLVAFGRRRALWLLPVLAMAVTAWRIGHHTTFGSHSFDRVDEIMAGGTLALLVARRWQPPRWATRPAIVLALFAMLFVGMLAPVVSGFPWIAYLRPYLATLLVGLSLTMRDGAFARLLGGRVLGYVARISYALYVLHPLSYAGWMGSGNVAVRYTKRIFSILIAFGGAHVSTFYFEQPLTRLGRRIAARWSRPMSVVPHNVAGVA